MSIAARIAVILLALSAPAQAQEAELGTHLVCDTREQAERFVAVFNGNVEAAANAVNAEVNDPTACAAVAAAYYRGKRIATAKCNGMTYEVVRVLVVGVKTQGGVQAVVPQVLFAIVKVEELDA
jgi:hypothetical protein